MSSCCLKWNIFWREVPSEAERLCLVRLAELCLGDFLRLHTCFCSMVPFLPSEGEEAADLRRFGYCFP